MATFVRIAAVLIGLANATLYASIADTPLDEAFFYSFGGLPPRPLAAMYALSAVVAGLLASEVVLRFVPGRIRGDFYARHQAIVLMVCVGGALLGAFSISVSALTEVAVPVAERILRASIEAPMAGFVGVWLGLTEGLLLGFPLAVLLGRFGDRPVRP